MLYEIFFLLKDYFQAGLALADPPCYEKPNINPSNIFLSPTKF